MLQGNAHGCIGSRVRKQQGREHFDLFGMEHLLPLFVNNNGWAMVETLPGSMSTSEFLTNRIKERFQ